MLHRSFKPAKCKTALKLAVSRIKLLNNKREVQLKQIKKELAQLLESGQVQSARVRVEHVVREEKTLTAYNLVEIYCELIAARLPVIESQKNCPIDLKEAITSVMFATPRCSDVPELADIKKHFTAKYGKEFITKAIELRPDCGVNRLLVEKLSTKSPDGPTKLKILTAIAEEHNVKWDPALFSESDPKATQDLLNGPNTFEMASKNYTEASPAPARSNQDDKGGTPNIQVSPQLNEKSDVNVNYKAAQNTRPSSGSENFASSGVSPNNATTSASFHPEERSSGTGTEWKVQKQSFPRSENDSLGRQDWTMHFKDAESAAQAAAESAERASLAARAAAELSRQHSSESPRRYGYSPKDEAPQPYTGSKLQGDHVSKVRENNAFHQRDSERRDGHIVDKAQEVRLQSSESQRSEAQIYDGSKFQSDLVSKDAEDKAFRPGNSGTRDEHIVEKGREEQASPAERLVRDDHNKNDRYSKEASIKSSTVSTQDASPADSFQRVDKYFHRRSSKSFDNDFADELTKKSHFGESQPVVDIHESMESEEAVYFDDRETRKQSSTVSHRSHSSSFSDDQEKVLRMNDDVTYSEGKKPAKQPSRASSRSNSSASVDIRADIFKRNDESDDPFVHDDSSLYREHSETIYNENTAAFDDYGSDGDNYKVDVLEYKEQETSVHLSSPVRKSSTNLLDDSAVLSPRRNTDEGLVKSASQSHPSVFSESSEVSSLPTRLDDLPPAAFDDYESQSSDSEEDLGKSKLTESTDFRKVPFEKSVHSRRAELVQSVDEVFQDENVESWRSPWSRPSVVDSQPTIVLPDRRSQRVKSTPVSEKKFDDHELPTAHPMSRRMRSRLESTVKETEEFPDTTRDSELLNESTFDSGKELNFGTLRGGLRNKGNRRPPYIRKTSEATFSVKEASSVTGSDVEQSSLPSPRVVPSIDSGTANQERNKDRASTKPNQKKSSWTFAKHGDSDDNHSEEEAQQETSITKQLHNQKSTSQQVKKPSSRDLHTYFDPDDSNSDEDVSKSSSPVTARLGAGLSRRTKPSSFKSGRTHAKTTVLSEEAVTPNYRAETRSSSSSSQVGETLPGSVGRPYSRTTVPSEEYVTPNSGVESKSSSTSSTFGETLPKTTGISYSRTNAPSRVSVTPSYRAEIKPFSSNSHVSDSSPKLFSETKSSDQMETWDRRRLVEQDIPKQVPESRRSSHMDSLKSRTSEPKSTYLPKSLESEKSETPSYRAESKSSASSARVSEASPKPLSETKISDQAGIRERHRLVQNDTPKPAPESIRSSRTDSSKSLRSEQKPKSPPVRIKPDATEDSNSPAVTRETSSKDKASHVHPNLPDSDSFTAFFQSLRK